MPLLQNISSSDVSIKSVSAAVVLAAFTWLIWKVIQEIRFRNQYNLPNLVPGLPIIGNGHQIPTKYSVLHYQSLAKRYGEMFTIKVGGVYWLFLNSKRVAHELLEKRAAIYSSRMSLPMGHNLISNQKRILLMPYGDLWRRERKIMHQILNGTQASIFEPYQDLESKALLFHYLQGPKVWWKTHAAFTGSVIMSVVFGRRAAVDDANLKESMAVSEEFVQFLAPGRAVVDHFPFLANIPWFKSLQPWRWYGDDMHRRTRNIYKKEIDQLRKRMETGSYNPCFMSEFLHNGHDQEFDEDEVYFIAGALWEAGTDTTRTSLDQCVAAAALWPDWYQRAREELDKVCGANADRLPTMQDMPNLPLIKAAVKESVRWKPAIADTGIPHALMRDDEFEGFKIPAGTVVTYNNWAVSNDPKEFDQPERFWPERFLDEDLDKPLKGHYGWGAGRRVCVGYNVAYTNLLIALSRIIYCFDIQEKDDAPIDTSKPLYPVDAIPPFQASVKVRSKAHAELIKREYSKAVGDTIA